MLYRRRRIYFISNIAEPCITTKDIAVTATGFQSLRLQIAEREATEREGGSDRGGETKSSEAVSLTRNPKSSEAVPLSRSPAQRSTCAAPQELWLHLGGSSDSTLTEMAGAPGALQLRLAPQRGTSFRQARASAGSKQGTASTPPQRASPKARPRGPSTARPRSGSATTRAPPARSRRARAETSIP